MELLERTLAYELGAKTSIEFRREGIHCSIAIPLSERVAVVGSA
jgi:hypothetical protein